MKILDNGLVEISNNKTGETKVIQPTDLGKYGIPLVSYLKELQAWQMLKTGQTDAGFDPNAVKTTTPKEPSEGDIKRETEQKMIQDASTMSVMEFLKAYATVPTEEAISTYSKASGKTVKKEDVAGLQPADLEKSFPKATDPQSNAEKIVAQLEDIYFGNKLAKGNLLGGKLSEIEATINKNSKYSLYRDTLEAARPMLAKAAGDSGNIAFAEQLQAGKPFPTAVNNNLTAEERFRQVRKKFGLPERKYTDIQSYGGSSLGDIYKNIK